MIWIILICIVVIGFSFLVEGIRGLVKGKLTVLRKYSTDSEPQRSGLHARILGLIYLVLGIVLSLVALHVLLNFQFFFR